MTSLFYGSRERTFTSVGANCVRCEESCGSIDAFNRAHASFRTILNVGGKNVELTLCGHEKAPGRNSDRPLRVNDSIEKCRVCLVKEPNFDPNSEIK